MSEIGMTSFTHNCEDILLLRALSDVTDGFYIDVGAYDPEMDSVTKVFYDRGWRGVNIEPNQDYYRRLQVGRPRDVNLAYAVSDRPATLELHVIGDTGLSTLDSDQARKSAGARHSVNVVTVEALTLAALWDRSVPVAQPVHFLKIDVEGAEAKVIAGADWVRHRPWILVIEATLPNTFLPSHENWEPMVLAAGYVFAYFDGVNRYYVANEQIERLSCFDRPVNPMVDDFKPFLAELIERNMKSQVEALSIEMDSLQAERNVLITRLQNAENTISGALKEKDLLQQRLDREIVLVGRLSETMNALTKSIHDLNETSESLHRTHVGLDRGLNKLADIAYQLRPRGLLERILIRANGKPRHLVRRVLFHLSGKPRGDLKRLVLHRDGMPRSLFRTWMSSASYQSLQHAVRFGSGSRAQDSTNVNVVVPEKHSLDHKQNGRPTSLVSPRARSMTGELRKRAQGEN